MRVIAGEAKGRRLKTPSGMGIRPTSDKVRGAIFDILRDVSELIVLDLFSGTGALGIEALSRGAARATFVDDDRRACDLVRENLELTGLGGRATVTRADAATVALHGGPFDLVLADPPYDFDALTPVLAAISGVLAPGGVVVVEHDARVELEDTEQLDKVDSRRWGSTAATFFRHRQTDERVE